MTGFSVLGTAVVRFHEGTSVALITGVQHLDARGYDRTERAYATCPTRKSIVTVTRIGWGLWRQVRT